jgi:hypothetical protein
LKNRSVVDQLVAEYEWTLARLAERGLAAQTGAGVLPALGAATTAPTSQTVWR